MSRQDGNSISATVISVAVTLLLMAVVSVASAQEPATHNFEEVAEGVFFATDAGQVYLMSNALVIVNEEDVVVVDSHVTPAAARALIESITGRPDEPSRGVRSLGAGCRRSRSQNLDRKTHHRLRHLGFHPTSWPDQLLSLGCCELRRLGHLEQFQLV